MGKTTLEFGTVGLQVAVGLYGQECVVSMGDHYTSGVVEVPDGDVDVVMSMVKEAMFKQRERSK